MFVLVRCAGPVPQYFISGVYSTFELCAAAASKSHISPKDFFIYEMPLDGDICELEVFCNPDHSLANNQESVAKYNTAAFWEVNKNV